MVGFYELFTTFQPYDDEGLFMLSNRLFLSGYTPYHELSWLFGPVQLALVKLVHGTLGVPITHTAVRFLTLGTWLLLVFFAGLLVSRLTHSRFWGMSALVLAFAYTRSIVNEPGHPQSVIAIAMLLVPLIPIWYSGQRQWLGWMLIGVVVASVFYIKINAGAFGLAAVSIIVLTQARPRVGSKIWLAVVVLVSLLTPFLLMLPLLDDGNCRAFALLCGLSAAAVTVVAHFKQTSSLGCQTAIAGLLGGFALVTFFALAYVTYLGISPGGIMLSLLAYASDQRDFYHFFREYSAFQLGMAGISLLLACSVSWTGAERIAPGLILMGRMIFCLAAIYAMLINDPANAQAMLGYAGPWVWLIVTGGEQGSARNGRLLLAVTAVWMPLLAYPIPGSQLYFGSLAILLAALVCAGDLVQDIQRRISMAEGEHRWFPRSVSVLVLVAAMAVLFDQFQEAREKYRQYLPLALPGTDYLHIEPQRAHIFRELVAAIKSADVVVSTSRFNSIYFWSEAQVPTPGYVSQWTLGYSFSSQQEDTKAGLLLANNPVVIAKKPRHELESRGDILDWIDNHFEAYREIGPYTLMRRRSG